MTACKPHYWKGYGRDSLTWSSHLWKTSVLQPWPVLWTRAYTPSPTPPLPTARQQAGVTPLGTLRDHWLLGGEEAVLFPYLARWPAARQALPPHQNRTRRLGRGFEIKQKRWLRKYAHCSDGENTNRAYVFCCKPDLNAFFARARGMTVL